jgi:hypothetical protein
MDAAPSPLNQGLSIALASRSLAETWLLDGKTRFWRGIGLGSIALGIGLGVGAGFIGYSYVARNAGQLDELSSVLAKRLAETKLQGKLEGVVELTPGQITLSKDQTVSLNPNATVYLDPSSKIIAEGEIKVRAPTISVPKLTRDDPSAAPTITNFTVFKTVAFAGGSVVTGWNFLTSAQQTPSDQYCYFTQNLDTPGLDVVFQLATDQKPDASKAMPKGFNYLAALDSCVWFKANTQ